MGLMDSSGTGYDPFTGAEEDDEEEDAQMDSDTGYSSSDWGLDDSDDKEEEDDSPSVSSSSMFRNRGGGGSSGTRGSSQDEDDEDDSGGSSSNRSTAEQNITRLEGIDPPDDPPEGEEPDDEKHASLDSNDLAEQSDGYGGSLEDAEKENTGLLDGGLTGDDSTNIFDTGLTGDEDTNIKDETGNALAEMSGAQEWSESEDAQELRDKMDDQGALGKFDTATRAGFDFLLDNPKGSVQEGLQAVMKAPTEAATGEEVSDEELAESFQDVGQATNERVAGAIEGTPFDNPVTDLFAAGSQMLIEDPAKAGLTAATGIDMDEGDSEGTVGAIDAFDVGVTIGTAGAGKAGLAALRGAGKAASGADEGASVLARLLGRGSDDAAAAADDAAAASDEATESVTSWLDEGAQGSDELARTGDDAAAAADDAAAAGDDVIDVSYRSVDEAAQAGDDVAAAADDAAFSLTDEAARLSDEAAQTLQEGGGMIRRALSGRAGKAGAAAAATLGGGAILNELGAFDTIELTDPQTGETFALVNEKQYPPTERRPNGGVLWSVRTGNQEEGFRTSEGYTIIVGASGRNVYILDAEGNERRAQVSADVFQQAIQRAKGGGAA